MAAYLGEYRRNLAVDPDWNGHYTPSGAAQAYSQSHGEGVLLEIYEHRDHVGRILVPLVVFLHVLPHYIRSGISCDGHVTIHIDPSTGEPGIISRHFNVESDGPLHR